MRVVSVMAWVASVGAIALAAMPAAAGAASRSPAKACSTSGLSLSFKHGSVTEGLKVEHLRASGVSCTTARRLARRVGLDELHNRKVPARIDGLTTKVTNPCGGCAPTFPVTAKAAGEKVTFTIAGGA